MKYHYYCIEKDDSKWRYLNKIVTKVYRVFEDNSEALEMNKLPKYRPRSRYFNVKIHHFRDVVTKDNILIHSMTTVSQLADYLNKPLKAKDLKRLSGIVMVNKYLYHTSMKLRGRLRIIN